MRKLNHGTLMSDEVEVEGKELKIIMEYINKDVDLYYNATDGKVYTEGDIYIADVVVREGGF